MSSFRHWGAGTLLALALVPAAGLPALAQVVIGSQSRPDVEVDHSVLDRLGPSPSLPHLFLGQPQLLTDLAPPQTDAAPVALHHPTSATPIVLHPPRHGKPTARKPQSHLAQPVRKPVNKALAPADASTVVAKKAVPAEPKVEHSPVTTAAAPTQPAGTEVAKPASTQTEPSSSPTASDAAPAVDKAPDKTAESASNLPKVTLPTLPEPASESPSKDSSAKDSSAKDSSAKDSPAKDAAAKDAQAKAVVADNQPPAPAKDESKPASAQPAPAQTIPAQTAPSQTTPTHPTPVQPTPLQPAAPEPPKTPKPATPSRATAQAEPQPAGSIGAPAISAPAEPPTQTQETRLPAATSEGAVTVAFDKDVAHLPDQARGKLTDLSARLAADQALQVQLLAYAEGDDDNASKARRLSLSRALAVRSFLIDQGVRSTRIEVRALGNKVPEGPADRVDILVQKR